MLEISVNVLMLLTRWLKQCSGLKSQLGMSSSRSNLSSTMVRIHQIVRVLNSLEILSSSIVLLMLLVAWGI